MHELWIVAQNRYNHPFLSKVLSTISKYLPFDFKNWILNICKKVTYNREQRVVTLLKVLNNVNWKHNLFRKLSRIFRIVRISIFFQKISIELWLKKWLSSAMTLKMHKFFFYFLNETELSRKQKKTWIVKLEIFWDSNFPQYPKTIF